MRQYDNVKKYELQAVLETTGGKLTVDCKMSKDGWIDGTFTDETGSFTKEFWGVEDCRNYIDKIRVKNVISKMEIIY